MNGREDEEQKHKEEKYLLLVSVSMAEESYLHPHKKSINDEKNLLAHCGADV